MKKLFYLLLSLSSYLTSNSQSLLDKIDSLQPQYTFYGYQSNSQIYLTTLGSMERQFPRIIFRKVDYDNKTGLFTISGFVNQTGAVEDSISRMGGLTVLIATKYKDSYLTNIRSFGKTFSYENSTNSLKNLGDFYLSVSLSQNDVILIGNPGTLYWGAAVVPIGQILKK